jgi:L-iditol 2-dehydrogenase
MHGLVLPRTLGHEITGVIAEVGSEVDWYSVGQRVAINVNIFCGECYYCRSGLHNLCDAKESISYQYDGGFAEYLRVPGRSVRQGGLISLPDNVDFCSGSLVEPFSCVLNGQELSNTGPGDTVVIIGAGPVGIMHAQLARIRGVAKIILADILNARLTTAAGVVDTDLLVDSSVTDLRGVVLRYTKGRGADVVIVAAPSGEAQIQALNIAAKRGRVNFFGGLPKNNSTIAIDSNTIHYRELFVHGTSDCTGEHMKKVVDLLSAGRLECGSMTGETYSLQEYERAFNTARSGSALKVIFLP